MGKSVERRLVADVNVGAFLSGGMNSSVIVTEMARISGKRVKTFSLGFKDADGYDNLSMPGRSPQLFRLIIRLFMLNPNREISQISRQDRKPF